MRLWVRVSLEEKCLLLEAQLNADRGGVVSFDQARLIRHNQILAANGIDPSGLSYFLIVYSNTNEWGLQECPWTQRLLRAYDRPGHLHLHSLPSCLTCYRRALPTRTVHRSLTLGCSPCLFYTYHATRLASAHNSQSLLFGTLSPYHLSPPGCRVVVNTGSVSSS